MAKWRAIFRQTEELQLPLVRFGRSSDGEHRLRHDRLSFRGRFPRCAPARVCLPEWFQVGAPATVIHQILQLRFAPCRNREPKSDSSRLESLHLRWKFADQVLDFFRFVSVTDQKSVLCSYHNEVMDSK